MHRAGTDIEATAPGVRRRRRARVALAAAVALAWAQGVDAAPAPTPPAWAYAVVPGDTLYDVVHRHCVPGTSWRALQRLNRVADPRRLRPGRTLLIPQAWLLARAVDAEVVHVQGEVMLWRAGQRLAVQPGTRVGQGDVLDSGEGAAVSLRLADGSRVLLRPNGRMSLAEHVRVGALPDVRARMRLERGDLDTVVPPAGAGRRFEVETPSAHLGVRGTEFSTHVTGPGAATRLEVIEGRVGARLAAGAAVSRPGPAAETAVHAGQGARVGDGSAPQVSALLPAPALQGAPERLERVPLRLAWVAAGGAVAYRAQVYAADDVHALLLDGLFEQPAARWTDLPDGRYELRVRAVDALGFEGQQARHAFVLKARPQPPFGVAPAASARVAGSPTRLAWTRPQGVAGYHLQVSTQEGFAPLLADVAGLSSPEHGLALAPGRYFWRVASVKADGDEGPFGDPMTFEQRALPAPPADATAQVDAEGIAVQWSAGAPGQRYELQLARDAAFTDIVAQRTLDDARAALERPPTGGYYLRVRSIDADGFVGPWGQPQVLEVSAARWWLWLLPLLVLVL